MTTPRIPKGWRKLRKGAVIRKGDKMFWSDGFRTCNYSIGISKGADSVVIRRLPKPKRKPANKKQGKMPTPFQELNGLKERFLARGDYYHASLIRDVIKQSREGGLLREFAK